jgi:hypothetical protein
MPITTEQFREMEMRTAKASRKVASPSAFDGKESELHKQIEEELKRRRWYYVHSRTDRATTQQKGVPDFIIAMPENKYGDDPQTLWIEVKKKGGKLSPEQTITKHVLTALGHRFAVVYSFQEFLEVINN